MEISRKLGESKNRPIDRGPFVENFKSFHLCVDHACQTYRNQSFIQVRLARFKLQFQILKEANVDNRNEL